MTGAALVTGIWLPEVWANKVQIFGTVGGFATFYGVAFAVIETWRARSASEDAEAAADAAVQQVTSLFDVKNLAECQSSIRQVLGDLDKSGWASTTALSRIGELYTEQFHNEYRDTASDHRINIAALQSHSESAPGPFRGSALKRLKSTLLKMQSEISAVSGSKVLEKRK